jgi:hypothetical protein
MKKDLIWSIFAIAVALLMFVVAACAAEPNANPALPTPAFTTQLPPAPHPGPRPLPPGDGPRPEMRELPRILMIAAINPQAKNDPEVQTLLDKVIADMQAMQQDEAVRLAAFQQLVQVERNGDADGTKKALEDLNAATQKVKADAKLMNQDVQPLERKLHELRPGEGGAAHTPAATPPAEK